MPRSPRSSTPPQDGSKRSRSSSPPQDGRRKASTSAPTNALGAIRYFFGRKMGVFMLLQFLIGTETSFNWESYQGPHKDLPEVQLTAEDVATWLLTLILRKPAPGEQKIRDQIWQRVLQFLRENAQLDELKPLFEFIKKYQRDMVQRNVIPNWVQLCLVPLCNSDAASISFLLSRSFALPSEFWQNAIQGLTPALLPFWFTEQTSHVWQHLLFQLLQQPLSKEVKQIVQAFFADKPFEFFMVIPIDILIFLSNNGVLMELNIRRYIFSPKRRDLGFFRIFVDDRSIENQIIQNFLRNNFPTIHSYISRTYPDNLQIEFQRVFLYPHAFFRKLLETPDLLVRSHICGQEMAKFLSLFCWHTSTFFPTCVNLNGFVSQIMRLPDAWKFLFVQLWRCEQKQFAEFHVGEFMKLFRQQERCLFSKSLASMMRVYMEQVVENADQEVRKYFFKWLLEQSQTIQAHFPLTRSDLQFCLREFSGVQTKKTLFWWLFTVNAAKIDQRSDRELTVNMTEICQEFGLQVIEEELGLMAQNGLNPIAAVSHFFNVITLNFEFRSCKTTKNFCSVRVCDRFKTEGANPFRGFIHRLRISLGEHINPKSGANCSALLCLIITCEARPDFFQECPPKDRAFLIKFFEEYLPKLSLTEELEQLLYRLSKLMPDEVKQAMFTFCTPIKILHEETLESTQGKKISRDPTDPLSYEARCSRCARNFSLQGLGLDGHGGAICRKCSQSSGTPILTPLGRLPFGSL